MENTTDLQNVEMETTTSSEITMETIETLNNNMVSGFLYLTGCLGIIVGLLVGFIFNGIFRGK